MVHVTKNIFSLGKTTKSRAPSPAKHQMQGIKPCVLPNTTKCIIKSPLVDDDPIAFNHVLVRLSVLQKEKELNCHTEKFLQRKKGSLTSQVFFMFSTGNITLSIEDTKTCNWNRIKSIRNINPTYEAGNLC